MTESVRLHEISRKHNPWYYNPLTGIPESRDGRPFPLFISRAKGSRVWDVRATNSSTTRWAGAARSSGTPSDRIQDAIRQVLDDGTILPFPHPAGDGRLEDADRRVPWQRHGGVRQERLRRVHHRGAARPRRDEENRRSFPAASMAGRTLRWTISVSKTAAFPAVRNGRSTNSAFNDRAGFLALYDQCKHDFAAVMIEPAGPLARGRAGARRAPPMRPSWS